MSRAASRHRYESRTPLPAALALIALVALACSSDDPVIRDASHQEAAPEDMEFFDILPDLGEAIAISWVPLDAGSFQMGSPETEACRAYDETLHPVTLTHGFEISATEITQAQFWRALRYNPALYQDCGSQCPVENISWHEAAAFCNALSQQKGYTPCYSCEGRNAEVRCEPSPSYAGAGIYSCEGYRLPTEAEWEYAYRAGTQSPYYIDTDTGPHNCFDSYPVDDPAPEPDAGPRDATVDTTPADLYHPDRNDDAARIAWYQTTSGGAVREVGLKEANSWGLYDVAGNVWEWCNDWRAPYPTSAITDPAGPDEGSYRILRGGGANSGAPYLRAAYRMMHSPEYRDGFLGLRVVRTR